MVLLSRWFDWGEALVVVTPKTLIGWHRAGFRLFWRSKCRRGRPRIPAELRALIRQMARDNISWGEERIANELLLKLGIQISPRTVRKYMPKRPPGRPRGDQRWLTFVHNHANAIVACDFLTVVTATVKCLYVFVVIELGRRTLIHINVTEHPQRRGHYNSYAKRYPPTTITNTYSTIETVFSPRVLMRPSRNWGYAF